MKQKTSQILFAYWNDVRGERMAPRRFEIEPARIATILPETFILERCDTDTFAYRLAGTKLCEQFGVEFRGTNFLADWSPDDRLAISRHFASTTAQGGVLVLRIEASPGFDDSRHAEFEIVLMPLVHTSSTVTRLLGAVSAIDPPAWLGTARLERKRLLSSETIWPDGRPHAVASKSRNQQPLLASLAGARLVKIDHRSFRVLDGGLTKADASER